MNTTKGLSQETDPIEALKRAIPEEREFLEAAEPVGGCLQAAKQDPTGPEVDVIGGILQAAKQDPTGPEVDVIGGILQAAKHGNNLESLSIGPCHPKIEGFLQGTSYPMWHCNPLSKKAENSTCSGIVAVKKGEIEG